MAFYAFPFHLFFLFFSIRLFKRKIPLWATCTTTNEHAEETPRHGAFFHLEIPSVIISGASRARRGGEEEQNTKLATTRWRGCLIYMTFFFHYFLVFYFHVLGFNVLWQYGFLQSEFFSEIGNF